jgi:hypothetical protein
MLPLWMTTQLNIWEGPLDILHNRLAIIPCLLPRTSHCIVTSELVAGDAQMRFEPHDVREWTAGLQVAAGHCNGMLSVVHVRLQGGAREDALNLSSDSMAACARSVADIAISGLAPLHDGVLLAAPGPANSLLAAWRLETSDPVPGQLHDTPNAERTLAEASLPLCVGATGGSACQSVMGLAVSFGALYVAAVARPWQPRVTSGAHARAALYMLPVLAGANASARKDATQKCPLQLAAAAALQAAGGDLPLPAAAVWELAAASAAAAMLDSKPDADVTGGQYLAVRCLQCPADCAQAAQAACEVVKLVLGRLAQCVWSGCMTSVRELPPWLAGTEQ